MPDINDIIMDRVGYKKAYLNSGKSKQGVGNTSGCVNNHPTTNPSNFNNYLFLIVPLNSLFTNLSG